MSSQNPNFNNFNINCYIHQVTDVKDTTSTSPNTPTKSWFNCTLQTGATSYVDAVIFDVSKHDDFVQIEKQKTMVEFQGINKTPSKRKHGESDYKVTKRTRLNYDLVTTSQERFSFVSLKSDVKNIKCNQIQKMTLPQNGEAMVSVFYLDV